LHWRRGEKVIVEREENAQQAKKMERVYEFFLVRSDGIIAQLATARSPISKTRTPLTPVA